MIDADSEQRDAEAAAAMASGSHARSLSDDSLISSSLAVVDAYTADLREASEKQRWAMRIAHRHGASLRQLAEVSGLHRNTVSKIINSDDTAA